MKRRCWCFSDDILMEVLSRMPTKALLQMKSVSKEWYSLISDRSFIDLQVKNREPVSGFLFQEKYQWCGDDIRSSSYLPAVNEGDKVNHTVLDFLPEDVSILSSNFGLICCRSCMPVRDPEIYICNPSNKNWISLKWTAPDLNDCLVLVFDPFRDPVNISTTFKVVKVHQIETVNDDDEEEVEEGIKDARYFSFEIFSSETGKWRASNEICHCFFNLIEKRKGMYIGGIIYWLTNTDQILTFHVENELSWILNGPFPTTEFESIPKFCIGESEGKLNYIMVSELGLFIWVLEDCYESKWELEFSITLEKLENENSRFLCFTNDRVRERVAVDMNPWVDPLAYKDGVLLMRVSTNMFLYRLKTGKMEEVCPVLDLGVNAMYFPTVIPYTMSLIPLNSSE